MERPKKTHSPARSLVRSISKSPLPAYLLDPAGRVAFANQALANLLKVPVEALANLDCRSSIPADASNMRLIASQLSCPRAADGAWLQLQSWNAQPTSKEKVDRATPLESIRVMIDLAGVEIGYRLGLILSSEQAPSIANWLQSDARLNATRTIHQSLVKLRARYERLDGLACLAGTSFLASKSLRQVQAVIETSHPVCLIGPEGVGKSEAAKAIYMARMKRQGLHDLQFRLYPVECRLMDTSLLGSVLEMLEMPTSASMTKVNQAIYLNRLDLLPLEVVPMLLAFLSQGTCEVLASFASAPSPSLHAGSQAWAELFATVDVHRVELAPLADRPGDIPILAELMMQGIAMSGDSVARSLRPRRIDSAAMQCLQGYGYPRNVQELRSILDHAVAECARSSEAVIQTKHLPIAVQTYPSFAETKHAVPLTLDLDRILEDVERTAIVRMLERFPKNRTLVAKHLGISRARLLRRLEQWGLDTGEDVADTSHVESTPSEAKPAADQTAASQHAESTANEAPATRKPKGFSRKKESEHRQPPISSVPSHPAPPTDSSGSDEVIEFTEIDFRDEDSSS